MMMMMMFTRVLFGFYLKLSVLMNAGCVLSVPAESRTHTHTHTHCIIYPLPLTGHILHFYIFIKTLLSLIYTRFWTPQCS